MPGPGHYESVIYGVGTDSKKYNIQGKTFNPAGKYRIPILQLAHYKISASNIYINHLYKISISFTPSSMTLN